MSEPRIWVIEDNDQNFELVDYLLGEAGYDVARARDASEIAGLLAGTPPALVLLDMNLPSGSGLDVLANLRADPRSRRAPVVALTAHAMRGDRERFLAAGFDTYVSKPINATELYGTIHTLLSGVRGAENAAPLLHPALRSQFPGPLHARSEGTPLPSPAPGPAASDSGEPSFDEDDALGHAGGDRELLYEVLDVFVEESAGWLAELERAAADKDGERLRRAAHTVKGAASNCGAADATALASAVERLAAAGDLATAASKSAELVVAMNRLTSNVRGYLRSRERRDSQAAARVPL